MGKAKPFLFLGLVVLGLILVSQSFRVQAQASSGLVVRIDPQQIGSLGINDNFTVYVWLDNAVGVEGAQMQFVYDPTVLNVTQVLEGPFLPSAGPTALAQAYAVENLGSTPPTGEVFYSSAITSGATASGNGILLNVTFRVVSGGASDIRLLAYKAGTGGEGTYFVNLNFEETIPTLENGYYGTPVSLSARPEVINLGQNTTLSGRVTGSAAVNVSSVKFEYLEGGGNWTDFVSLPVDSSGSFSIQWPGAQEGDFAFRVSFVMEGKTGYSSAATVTVVNIVSHEGYVYAGLIALVVVIVTVVAVQYIRIRRRPEDLPSMS
jgi:hypothetical protein